MPKKPLFGRNMPSKSITLPIEMWEKLDNVGANLGTTPSAVIRTVLTKHLCKMYSGKCSVDINADENLGDA